MQGGQTLASGGGTNVSRDNLRAFSIIAGIILPSRGQLNSRHGFVLISINQGLN